MELWAAIVGDGKIRFAPSIIDEDDLLGAQFAFGYKLGRPLEILTLYCGLEI